MENFIPVSATIGNFLIGISATLLLFFNGRLAGILGGLVIPTPGGTALAGAVVITLMTFRLVLKRPRLLFSASFQVPARSRRGKTSISASSSVRPCSAPAGA